MQQALVYIVVWNPTPPSFPLFISRYVTYYIPTFYYNARGGL